MRLKTFLAAILAITLLLLTHQATAFPGQTPNPNYSPTPSFNQFSPRNPASSSKPKAKINKPIAPAEIGSAVISVLFGKPLPSGGYIKSTGLFTCSFPGKGQGLHTVAKAADCFTTKTHMVTMRPKPTTGYNGGPTTVVPKRSAGAWVPGSTEVSTEVRTTGVPGLR